MSLLAILPLWLSLQGPLTNLKASYPYGDQLAMAVTPDGLRGFVAEGASVAILDLTGAGEPNVITRIPVPECSPRAIEYLSHPMNGHAYLFVAGGSMGLWRLTLCPGIPTTPCFGSTPPYSFYLGPDLVSNSIIELAGEYERKRCVDVAVVGATGGAPGGYPILCALFAASSDTATTMFSPTELRAYRLRSEWPYDVEAFGSPVLFPSTTSGPAQTGTALVADPGDPDSVYVSLGKGGIWRVDLTSPPQALTKTQILGFPSSTPSITIDNVRDLAIARPTLQSGPKSFLYAALNYGRILEFDLSTPGSPPIDKILDVKYVERIAATTDGGSSVLVAVACELEPAITTESRAPYRTTGLWTTICIGSGIGVDPDEPSGGTAVPVEELRFFGRDADDPLQPRLLPVKDIQGVPLRAVFGPHWGSLSLRTLSFYEHLCYATTAADQTNIYKLSFAFGPGDAPSGPPSIDPEPPSAELTLLRQYTRNLSFGAWDGSVSDVNPKLMRFGLESGAGLNEGGMMYVDRQGDEVILTPIADTQSVCSGGFPYDYHCDPSPCKARDPNPFVAHIFGEAHWVDPAVPTTEWFMGGGAAFTPIEIAGLSSCTCNDPSLPVCQLSPCLVHIWRAKENSDPGRSLGFRLTRLDLFTDPPTRVSTSMDWFQVPVPDDLMAPHRTDATDYVRSDSDPRIGNDGVPLLVHGVRGSSEAGYIIYEPRGWMQQAGSSSCGPPNEEGIGQELTEDPSRIQQIVTHLEFEVPLGFATGCAIDVTRDLTDPTAVCPSAAPPPNPARYLLNSRSTTFSVTNSKGEAMWITAVATGFSAAGPINPTTAQCLWRRYFSQPTVAFYDVTETGSSFKPPRLLRVAVRSLPPSSDPEPQMSKGTAWVIATKQYGLGPDARTLAFVGDLTGKLLVYDVSYDELYGAATSPYIANITSGVPNTPRPTALLLPKYEMDFPIDPYDGLRCNCVDLEIYGNYLYCALGRAGVEIIDIANPLQPLMPLAVIDTPGMALGLTLRPEPAAPEGMQLIVGDSRCGLRVYE